MAWVLGIFIYFSDSFSPLFVGSVMRSITDKAKVSREKLAYIADSTSAPVSVLMPITGWGGVPEWAWLWAWLYRHNRRRVPAFPASHPV